MNKILVIVGPTSTGKTRLALRLAKKFGGEIVSADSRQIYKGMDIGTGKDLPENFEKEQTKFGTKYLLDGVALWGYDLIDPKEKYDITKYCEFARGVIGDIQRRGKLPILVGGTGFYIKGVIDGVGTGNIPKNEKLRENLKDRAVGELYEHLSLINPIHAGNLNVSDKNNPRRLIRAIEISRFLMDNPNFSTKETKIDATPLFIGLRLERTSLLGRISESIRNRIEKGQEKEVSELIKNGITWDDQSMSSLGYRQWKGYFENTLDLTDVISLWESDEKKYVRRQITWFKKDLRIKWFDVYDPKFSDSVEKTVEKWYLS